MPVRCPQCHHEIELSTANPPANVRCDSCGADFTRRTAETISFVADPSATAETIVYVRTNDERHPDTNDPTTIGDYEIIAEIARGGMGIVYKARQRQLNRIVALKMIKAGDFAGDEEIERFRTEAEAAAQLDHPNIVPVYEVCELDGRHFFSMGFIDGNSLQERLHDGPLPAHQAVEFLRTIAEAVQFAHIQGIVHRDLKPGNVLIDSAGNPRITDFGLAKRIGADSGLTATGQVMGTPSYMPPEQASGQIDNVGPLADVYSLGAILYCLLTGRPPFQAANVIETLKLVLEQEPVAPRQLNPAIDRDLETICLKCLEKDPAKRYRSAAELAEELQRVLAGQPVLARPVGKLEQAWRWCQRNRVVASLLAVVFVSMSIAIGSLITGYVQVSSALTQKNVALAKAARSLDEKKEALRAKQSALTAEQQALAIKQQALDAETAARKLAEKRARQVLAQQLADEAESLSDRDLPLSLLLAAESVDLSLKSNEPVEATAHRALWQSLFKRTGRKLALPSTTRFAKPSLSSDGRWIHTEDRGFRQARSQLWDLNTAADEIPAAPLQNLKGTISATATSPDSRWLAIGFSAGLVRLHDLTSQQDGSIAHSLSTAPDITSLGFDQTSRLLVAGSGDGSVRIWNVAEHEVQDQPVELQTVNQTKDDGDAAIREIVFSPDNRWLAVTANTSCYYWKLEQTEQDNPQPVTTAPVSIRTGFGGRVAIFRVVNGTRDPHAEFSPDSRWLLAQSNTQRDVTRLRKLSDPDSSPNVDLGLTNLFAFGPNGDWVATRTSHRTVKLWNLKADDPRQNTIDLTQHQATVESIVFSKADRRFATASIDGTVFLWRINANKVEGPTRLQHDSKKAKQLLFGPDGQLLAALLDSPPAIQIWKLQSNGETTRLHTLSIPLTRTTYNPYALRFSPTADHIACTNRSRFSMTSCHSYLWQLSAADPNASRASILGDFAGPGRHLSFSNNGHWIVAGNKDFSHSFRLTGNAENPAKTEFVEQSDSLTCRTFDPTGRWLAIGRFDGSVHLHDLNSNSATKAAIKFVAHQAPVKGIVFGDDSQSLTTLADQRLKVWEVEGLLTNDQQAAMKRQVDNLGTDLDEMQSSRDGRHLLVRNAKPARYGGNEYVYCGLNTIDPKIVRFPAVGDAQLAPDGSAVLTTSKSGVIEFVPLNNPQQRVTLGQFRTPNLSTSSSAQFSPDGRWILSTLSQHRTELWHYDTDGTIGKPISLKIPPSLKATALFSPDGTRLLVASPDHPAIHVWKLNRQEKSAKVTILGGHAGGLTDLTVNRDGTSVVTRGQDDTLRLWTLAEDDTHDSIVLHRYIPISYKSSSLSQTSVRTDRLLMSRDGHRLLWYQRGFSGPTVSRLPLTSEPLKNLVSRAKELANRELTAAEKQKYHLTVQE